jgi:hypothetical protein
MGKQVKLDPIRAAYEENKLANNTKFYNPLNNLEDDSKYLQGFDAVNANSINDYKANKQKWYEALTNSLVKNTAKAGIRYVDGFAGIATAMAYDIPDYISNGWLSDTVESIAGDITDNKGKSREGVSGFLESIFDNAYSQNISRPLEEWLDKELPVYQTEKQQQSYGVGNLGFLDKVLDGVAYVVGMRGGAKAATMGAKGLGKIGSLMSAAARQGKDLNYVKNLFGNTADDLIGALGKGSGSTAGEIVKNAWDDLFGAVVESGAEASETKKTIFENLKRKAIIENGGNPLTKEQEAELDKQASVGGAANFMINLVTTGMVNNVVFKPLIKSKWLDDAFDNKAINNELINPNFIGKKGTEYVLDKANKNQKLYQKLFQNNIAKYAGLELVQELVQFASNDYFVNLLSDPSKQSVEDIADLYSITTKNGLEALLKTGNNLSSVDAVHSALIGGLIGGGAGALQDFSSKGAIDANTQYAIDYANRNSLANKDVTAAIKNFAKSKEYSQVADAASKNGDRLTYETAKYLGFANYVNARVNMSKFEDVLEDLKELKTKPLEDFIKQFDLTDYRTFDAKKRDEMIDYAIGVANQIKNSQDKIMTNYGHKISALEAKSPDNEKILPFLTSLDALKANYTNRENELIDKFKANGVDYTAFQKKEKSEEQIAASRGKIGELTSQLSALQADKSMSVDDRLKQINEISNQLVKANDELQRTVTESTYKELFKKELTDEFQPEVDEKSQRAIYETFSKDIKDFTQIQTAKEKLIDFYSKIINDESYAEKVAKKLVARNQDDEISNLFTLKGNINEDKFELNSNTDSDNYQESYIKSGDVYNLNKKIDVDDPNEPNSNLFEVIDTRTKANQDGSLSGEVKISDNKGFKEWLGLDEFKSLISPISKGLIKINSTDDSYQKMIRLQNAISKERPYSEDFEEDNDTTVKSNIHSVKKDEIIKTKAPSEYANINEGDYQVEKQNFFKYFYQVPVDPSKPLELEVEVKDDTIYLKFNHNKLPMVTTLAASNIKGSKLDKFRNKIIQDYNKNLAEGNKTYLIPNGKISLFEKGSINRPIQEVFSDIDLDIEVISGVAGQSYVDYPVGSITYTLKNGRPYLINGKLGIVQPIVVGTLEEAKIIRYDSLTKKKQSYSLTDVILNNIKFLQVSKLKKSDNDYQKDISNFYSNLNSFVYTANFDAIGTDKGMKKGAIDIIERDGVWALGYLDEKGNKQLVPIFDENNEINQIAKEQLGRRLVNPKLESLAEEGKKGFRYDEPFFLPVDFYLQKDGTPKLLYKDDTGYTYSTFLKESGGLKSNLAVQNIADKPTYFKGGYFTFEENVKVSNGLKKATTVNPKVEVKEGIGKDVTESIDISDYGDAIERALGLSQAAPKKKSLAEAGKNMAESIFGAKGTSIEESPITPNPVTKVEPSTDKKAGAKVAGRLSGLKGLGKQKDFQLSSLKIAKTPRLENITQEEVNEARIKFEKNYGVNFELVNGLINNYSWGRVTEAGNVLLSDSAPLGTSYHEEFHLVSQHILSSDELDDLYKEARVRYGDKSDYELEETLAEGFRMFANGYKGFTGKIAYYFNKLLNTMKALVGIKDTPINQLYKDILFGKYYGKPIYKGTVRNNEALNYDEKQKVLGDITKSVISLIRDNAYDGDVNEFVQFIDDSFFREKLLKVNIEESDVADSDEDIKELVAKNANLINFYFNVAANDYINDLESNNPLMYSKLANTYDENSILQDSKIYFNRLLKTNIEEEITEEEQAATADVRKKGDAEVDFFTGNLTKLRLLIVNESDGTEYGSLNPASFMSMIYNHIRDNSENISTFEQFKAGLDYIVKNEKIKNRYGQEYIDGLSNIMTMLDFDKKLTKNTNRSKIQLQNLLFEVFSKVENEFQVMKVISDTEDGNNIITRAFVNQTVAKQFDNIDKKVKASITDYLIQDKAPLGNHTNADLARVANELFGTNIYNENSFPSNTKEERAARNQMIFVLNSITKGQVGKDLYDKKNIDRVLDYNKTSIDNVISKIATLEGVDKVFNIRNAEGSPQYSLSNYSSLHKKMEEYATKSNPVKSDLEFTGLVMMNGIQTKGE